MLKLRVVGRKNPKTSELAYYPALVPVTPVDTRVFVEDIVKECTVTRADVLAVLSSLQDQMVSCLLSGMSVRMGLLGSFHLSAQTSGETEEKDVSAKNIEAVRVQFTPSPELMHRFDTVDNSEVKLVLE